MRTRGSIYNPERARQLRDYSGLIFGTITPTDIDGLIEYQNIGYVIMEFKQIDNIVPYGQRLALERLSDDLCLAGKNVLCIIASHQTDADKPIDTASCEVLKYRHNGKWRIPNSTMRTRDLIKQFIDFLSKK